MSSPILRYAPIAGEIRPDRDGASRSAAPSVPARGVRAAAGQPARGPGRRDGAEHLENLASVQLGHSFPPEAVGPASGPPGVVPRFRAAGQRGRLVDERRPHVGPGRR